MTTPSPGRCHHCWRESTTNDGHLECSVCPDLHVCVDCVDPDRTQHTVDHPMVEIAPHDGVEHKKVYCAQCEMFPLKGVRYQCQRSGCINLCADCKTKWSHSDGHVMNKTPLITEKGPWKQPTYRETPLQANTTPMQPCDIKF